MYKKDTDTSFSEARKTSCSSGGKDPDPEIVIYICRTCNENLVLREEDSCKDCLDYFAADWPEA